MLDKDMQKELVDKIREFDEKEIKYAEDYTSLFDLILKVSDVNGFSVSILSALDTALSEGVLREGTLFIVQLCVPQKSENTEKVYDVVYAGNSKEDAFKVVDGYGKETYLKLHFCNDGKVSSTYSRRDGKWLYYSGKAFKEMNRLFEGRRG